jgi:hypothetical protein
MGFCSLCDTGFGEITQPNAEVKRRALLRVRLERQVRPYGDETEECRGLTPAMKNATPPKYEKNCKQANRLQAELCETAKQTLQKHLAR